MLYGAQIAYDDVRTSRRQYTDPGIRDIATAAAARIDPSFIAWLETDLDPWWLSVLKTSTDFCGLKLSELAKTLSDHTFMIYEALYPVLSRVAHARDAHRHMRLDETTGAPTLATFSDEEEIQTVLYFSTSFMIGAVDEVADLVDFGPEFKERFREYVGACGRIYNSEPMV